MNERMIFLDPRNLANPDVPNIGLAYAATHYGVRVVDQHIRPKPRDRILEQEADVLGISVRLIGLQEAQRLKAAYAARYPHARIVSVRSCLEVQCCYPYLDLEETIEYAAPFDDNLPIPDYRLFDSFAVLQQHWQSGAWAYPLMTSTGCPFGCTYCAARRTRWQARSPAHCVEELRWAQKHYGIQRFQVMDDCFNVDIERAIAFCESVAPLQLTWGCANGLRADRFNAELAQALAASGCRHISFGIESSDPAVLQAIQKGETIEQIEEAVALAQRYLGAVSGFFILGLPGSSYESDLASIRWALRHHVIAHFSYYVPVEQETDVPFYGPGAAPRSTAYSPALQKKLYELTACWRGGEPVRRFAYLRLLWTADRREFWRTLAARVRALGRRLLPAAKAKSAPA